MEDLKQIEGKKFCVVLVKVLDKDNGRVQLQCIRGRASIDRGELKVVGAQGNGFTVPRTALPTVSPNDGTEILKDAEYFAMVKVDPNIELGGGEEMLDDVSE